MALFGKKKSKDSKDKDRILGVEFEKDRYDSLQNLLIGEVSLNSDDAKAVSITFADERVITLWVSRDRVLAAADSTKQIDFRPLLYWVGAPDDFKTTRIIDIKELAPACLPLIGNFAPEFFDGFVRYVNNYSIEKLKWINNNFESYTDVDTEIFSLPKGVDALSQIGVPITGVQVYLKELAQQEHEVTSLIGISGIENSRVTLILNGAQPAPRNPTEKFVLAAAESNSNLESTFALSDGFRVLEILKFAKELAEVDVIDIKIEEDAAWEMPELTDAPVKPYERIFAPTEMYSPILELTEIVFEHSSWRDAVVEGARNNQFLETRIIEIEEKLVSELASESFVEFQELPGDIQSSVRILLNDRTIQNARRLEILNHIQENIAVQNWDLDKKLNEAIDAKIAGIHAAIIKCVLEDLTPVENDFDLEESEPEFNFNDAVIETDDSGEPFIREIAQDEDVSDQTALDTAKFLDQAESEGEEVAEVNRDAHAFDFDEYYEGLSAAEKAGIGIRRVEIDHDSIPPIFLQVAASLGVDPKSVV